MFSVTCSILATLARHAEFTPMARYGSLCVTNLRKHCGSRFPSVMSAPSEALVHIHASQKLTMTTSSASATYTADVFMTSHCCKLAPLRLGPRAQCVLQTETIKPKTNAPGHHDCCKSPTRKISNRPITC